MKKQGMALIVISENFPYYYTMRKIDSPLHFMPA
jgi:hypothetical protein